MSECASEMMSSRMASVIMRISSAGSGVGWVGGVGGVVDVASLLAGVAVGGGPESANDSCEKYAEDVSMSGGFESWRLETGMLMTVKSCRGTNAGIRAMV